MPTIHIHLPADDQSLVAELLNRGYTVSLTTDLVEPVLARASSSFPSTKLLAEIHDYEAERRAARKAANQTGKVTKADRAARQRYYDDRRALAESATMAVRCTTCKVPALTPCRTASGNPYSNFCHTERIMAYRRWEADHAPVLVDHNGSK